MVSLPGLAYKGMWNYKISNHIPRKVGEGEGEVAVFSAKRWDRRNRADLIESATPFHEAQVVGSYQGLHHCATTPSMKL